MSTSQRPIKSLDDLMDGAVSERFNTELTKIWDNVFDPNTKAETKRKLTLTITVVPNEKRDAAILSVDIVPKFAPSISLSNMVTLSVADSGKITAMEITHQIPGQIDMDGEEAPIAKVTSFVRSVK